MLDEKYFNFLLNSGLKNRIQVTFINGDFIIDRIVNQFFKKELAITQSELFAKYLKDLSIVFMNSK